MSQKCPYCELATKKGQLYCSRHTTDMTQLKSGVFYIQASSFEECDWHVTRLSLNFNLDDRQTYLAGGRSHQINPQKYLLLNEGQSFKTSAASSTVNRMVTVAFQVGLAEQIMRALTTSESDLFDRSATMSTVRFPEKTYSIDKSINDLVFQLLDPLHSETQIQTRIENLLLHVLTGQLRIRKEILGINKVKVATREEIYKRMHWSLDYLHENFSNDISVDCLAEHSCLSAFHYKRLFHQVFGIPPYQYLKKLRLEKACELLKLEIPVQEVCRKVGWKDPSSFARLFKSVYRKSPIEFQLNSR